MTFILRSLLGGLGGSGNTTSTSTRPTTTTRPTTQTQSFNTSTSNNASLLNGLNASLNNLISGYLGGIGGQPNIAYSGGYTMPYYNPTSMGSFGYGLPTYTANYPYSGYSFAMPQYYYGAPASTMTTGSGGALNSDLLSTISSLANSLGITGGSGLNDLLGGASSLLSGLTSSGTNISTPTALSTNSASLIPSTSTSTSTSHAGHTM